MFDDDPNTVVEWEGFDLDSAFQGQQGYELVQKSIETGRPYAVAFVDIRMPPGWDGVHTVQKIWEIDPEILIVFCSAYSDYSWEEMVRQLGRNDRFLILKKPFDNIEVRQCAMALTERWSVSRTDVLTGLLNRRAFQGHLNLEWSRAERHKFPLACAMVDLDFFKRINDTLGHKAGDLVLKSVAQVLQTQCRASDSVCRYGGEELCVLLPHSNDVGAEAWAENMRRAIENLAVQVGDQVVHPTASIGIAERLDEADTIERLIDRADQALLVAKGLGRNRVIRYATLGESGPILEEVRRRSNFLQGVTARQIMSSPVVCLDTTSTVGEAADFFLQYRINSAPVIDAEGKLAGMLGEKDVVGILFDPDAWKTPIERIMQRNVISFDEEAPAQSICEFLSRVSVRRVVIVRGGRPLGVVSRGSMLRWYSNWVAARPVTAFGDEEGQVAATHRTRVIQGAKAVAECAADLSTAVNPQVDDLVPPIIDGISKLQELINNLLSCSSGNDLPPPVYREETFPREETTTHDNGGQL